jgi:hypothetical protein
LGNQPFSAFVLIISETRRCYAVIGPSFAQGFVLMERFDIAVILQPGKSGIKRGFLHNVFLLGKLLDVLGDFIAI